MSSNAIRPTWAPFSSTLSAEERLVFSLRLMNGRWDVPEGAHHPVQQSPGPSCPTGAANVPKSSMGAAPRGVTSVPLGTPRLSPLCLAEDWSAERPFTGFQLGDILNIQAEVSTESHVPLRLFVDSCVAALSPDGDSSPHYSIIDFNG